LTEEQFHKHLESVAAGPRTEEEIAEAERRYRARIAEGRAEVAAAEFQARRPPGAAPVSRLAGLRAAMPGFGVDLANLPEVPAVETVEEVAPAKNGNAAPLDREILKALGQLFIETKREKDRAQAWEAVEDAIMINLYRLAPGWGTIKDLISLARGLDEYSNPVATGKARNKDGTKQYRKALLMDGEEE
jgi:hypothetical protein